MCDTFRIVVDNDKKEKMNNKEAVILGASAVVGVFTMGFGGLLVGPAVTVFAWMYSQDKKRNEQAARQRDIERRTRYHVHYRGD